MVVSAVSDEGIIVVIGQVPDVQEQGGRILNSESKVCFDPPIKRLAVPVQTLKNLFLVTQIGIAEVGNKGWQGHFNFAIAFIVEQITRIR